MASIKDLKKRISSVKNTQQTTKALKMVSAAKLRRAQEAILNQRPYAFGIRNLMDRLLRMQQGNFKSSLIRTEGNAEEKQNKRVLLLAISSDRGSCGGFNSNIVKGIQRWVRGEGAQYASVSIAFVGKKAYDFFRVRSNDLGPYYPELGGKVTFEKAKTLANKLTELYEKKEFDEVKVIYNEFQNAVTQKVAVEHFLPLVTESHSLSAEIVGEASYLIKPSLDSVLSEILKKYFAIQAFRILLESQAGEHGARMSAMENATKNAGEMIRKLTLQFNKQRQANITKELLEIISGSESQKSA